jgi:hypothetical protein
VITQVHPLTKESFDGFMSRRAFKSLIQPDMKFVNDFSSLVDGGEYRVDQGYNFIKRSQDEDKIVEIESSYAMDDYVKKDYPDAHLHQNLIIYENQGGKKLIEIDAISHGSVDKPTFALLLESKFKVHQNDIDKVNLKVASFEKLILSSKSNNNNLYATLGSYQPKEFSLSHFHNVREIYPILSGSLFRPELINLCHDKKVSTISPSGAKYAVKILHKLFR